MIDRQRDLGRKAHPFKDIRRTKAGSHPACLPVGSACLCRGFRPSDEQCIMQIHHPFIFTASKDRPENITYFVFSVLSTLLGVREQACRIGDPFPHTHPLIAHHKLPGMSGMGQKSWVSEGSCRHLARVSRM